MDREEIVVCVICDSEMHKDHTHNAEPVSKGECCEDCNYQYVVPARLQMLGIKY